jgi:hypothetical protein
MRPGDPPTPRLPPDLALVVEAARADVGDAARLQAIAARLGPQLASTAPAGASLIPHAVIGALVAGGVTIAVVHGTHRPAVSHVSAPVTQATPAWQPLTPPEPPATQPAPAGTDTPQAAPASSPQDTTSRPSASRPGRTGGAALPSTRAPDPVVQEHEILAQARRSLDSNPDDTLARVADHERHFPDGALTSERELLRILALARLGRVPEARAARDAFLMRWPTSAYRNEVERLLGP